MSLAALGGSTTANSYLTVAEADVLAGHTSGTLQWDSATTGHKETALIQATQYLDGLGWIGKKAAATQPLAWPRQGASCGDKTYDAVTIPREVERATFDMAEAVLGNPAIITGQGSAGGGGGSVPGELVPGIPNSSLRSLQLDVMRLEFKDGASSSGSVVKTPLTVLPHLSLVLGCLTTSVAGRRSVLQRVRS